MNKLSCYTCRWWDNSHPRLATAPDVEGIGNPGFCRKHKPGAYGVANESGTFHIGVQPIMDGADFCAEHTLGAT